MFTRSTISNISIFLLLIFQLQAQVKTGAERSAFYYPSLKNKHIGVVANKASVIGNANIVDVLLKDGLDVSCIFSPEHGFRIDADAGETVTHSIDPQTGIRVISLYGNRKKPSKDDFSGLDVIVFDIQDVGVRFYTYISTLTLVMESCAEQKIPLVILDRPNPNGFYIDGPVLEKQFASFVGMHPVPIVYGMTIGEYALMVNGEKWLKDDVTCKLLVVPMENYTHQMFYELPVKPSPNLPNMNAIRLYPSLCLFEGTIVSIGRGTQTPFEVFGHPEFSDRGFSFVPQSVPGMSLDPPYKNQVCFGNDLKDFLSLHPDKEGRIILGWLLEAFQQWQGKSAFFNSYFNQLAGTGTLQNQIMQGFSEKKIRDSWKPGLDKFKKIRKRYLLYK